MDKKEKKKKEDRLAELRTEQIRLQAQCYLMKKGLEVNEIQLGQVGVLIAEHEAEGNPEPVPGGAPPDA